MWIITFYVVNEVVIYIYTHVSIRIQIYRYMYGYISTYICIHIHIQICMHIMLTQLSLSLFISFSFFSYSVSFHSSLSLSVFFFLSLFFSVSYLSTCLLSPCSWRRLLVEDRFCFVLKRARTHPNYVLYHVKNGNKVVDQFLFLMPCGWMYFPTD